MTSSVNNSADSVSITAAASTAANINNVSSSTGINPADISPPTTTTTALEGAIEQSILQQQNTSTQSASSTARKMAGVTGPLAI